MSFILKRLTSVSPSKSSVRTLFVVSDNPNYKAPAKPKYNYRKYGYNLIHSFDPTLSKISENSKMLVVTGNLFSMKSTLAKNIAPHFNLTVHEDITDDDLYLFKGPGGVQVDLREHNNVLPDRAKYFDTSSFWMTKDLITQGKPLLVQTQYLIYRFYRYSLALCDLLNTGLGQIVVRSPFEEAAFVETMFKCDMISERAYGNFCKNQGVVLKNVWKPHLIIYVKATMDQIMQRLKERNVDWEINSPHMNEKFFKTYEESIESYLEKMVDYSEVVVVDRRRVDIENEDDIQILANELSNLKLTGDRIIGDDKKFQDWRAGFQTDYSWANQRSKFSNAKDIFNSAVRFVEMPFDMSEGQYSEEIIEIQQYLKKKDPRFAYKVEDNPKFYSPFQIAFNPLHPARNFEIDYPKIFVSK